MKNLPILVCGLSLALILTACGGGGATTGGGSGSLALTYDLKGYNGTLVNNVTASQTPQSVQVNVNGTVRTVNNAIVVLSLSAGSNVVVFSEGSKLLNVSIPNTSAGASIGNLGYTVPISSNGTITASVVSGSLGLTVKTPPATWHSFSMPNGVTVGFFGSVNPGEMRSTVNSTIGFPTSVGLLNGTLPVTYTSPGGAEAKLEFTTANSSWISYDITGSIGTNANMTAAWQSNRAGGDASVITDAAILADF